MVSKPVKKTDPKSVKFCEETRLICSFRVLTNYQWIALGLLMLAGICDRYMYFTHFLYPSKTNVFGGILESACMFVSVSVCVSICVLNPTFCQIAGRGIKSHSVIALVFSEKKKSVIPCLSSASLIIQRTCIELVTDGIVFGVVCLSVIPRKSEK